MSDELYKRIFSKNLRYYMELNHKTQVDIINDLGFDKSAVSTWVNGTRLPRMDKVDALAKYLGIRRSDLIEERTSKAPSSDLEELAELYQGLNRTGREIALNTVRGLSANELYKKDTTSELTG